MISKRNYFSILILLIMVFVLFMFAGVSSNLLSDASQNNWSKEKESIRYKDTVTAISLDLDSQYTALGGSNITDGKNASDEQEGDTGQGRTVSDKKQKLRVAIMTESAQDKKTSILIEWCVYNKYLYKVYSVWPEAEVIEGYDVVVFGNYRITSEDYNRLYTYAQLGKIFIFTQLPDYQIISSDSRLQAYYGIKEAVNKSVETDGIKIFSKFMINKERNYRKGDYFGEEDDTSISIPYYSLSPGYDVYAVGIIDNQAELGISNKNLPPLLWRTATGKSTVFVVNSDIFEGIPMLGILTGFMSHASECYLYPIINAQTISLLNYPYFSDENIDTMKALYSRPSDLVARDLLWPNIVQILKKYGNAYSFFAAPQLDYLDFVEAKGDYTEFYLREVAKLPGVMGLSLHQFSNADLKDIILKDTAFFRQYLPNYDITALYSGDFSIGEVADYLDLTLFKQVSLVMSDYKEGDQMISYLNDNVLSVKFNLDGYQHETRDDLQMCCIENALGMCNEKVDIGYVIYPEDRKDQWNYLSLKWSKGDTYFKDFSMLDMVSIYEMENRVRRFLALDYTYQYDGDSISIHIEHFNKEAYFILSIYSSDSRKIEDVENGSAEAISASAYLIKARGADVQIQLQRDNMLQKPKNNKIIPSNPK